MCSFGSERKNAFFATQKSADECNFGSLRMASSSLAIEREFLTQHRKEFYESHPGEFALIKGERLWGFFKTYSEALAKGYSSFGLSDSFLVQRIEKDDELVVFQRVNLADYISNV